MEISPHFCSVLGGGVIIHSKKKHTQKKRDKKRTHTHKKKRKIDVKNDPFFVCMDP